MTKSLRKYVYILFVFMLQGFVVEANNVRIIGDVRVFSSNIENDIATFDFVVEWENSWRDGFNYDGVYLFLKYKLKGDNEEWHRLYLMNEGIQPSGGFDMELKNTTSVPNQNEGFFLYRDKSNQSSGKSVVTITAKWLISSNPDNPLKMVHFAEGNVLMVAMGIEMVYVPRGAFRIGDTHSTKHFRNNYLPFPEKYDMISHEESIHTSSVVSAENPDPKMAINRINDLSSSTTYSGYPSNAWYGDKGENYGNGFQFWSIRFPTGQRVKYIAIESVPGYVPEKWELHGLASDDTEEWETIHTGVAEDWETSLTRVYPATKAIEVQKNGVFLAYRIYVNQKDMPNGFSGNPPLIKNVSMTTVDLGKVLDNSVLVDSPSTILGGQVGLAADTTDEWTGALHIHYPNGYPAFWAMKYEISQDQYVAFLNKLTASQQRQRTVFQVDYFEEGDYVFGRTRNTPSFRNKIRLQKHSVNKQPMVFDIAKGGNTACNYLSAADMLAYAHWCGLRPLSEMEYEKMCRAFHPFEAVRGEYPWNTTSHKSLTGLEDSFLPTEAPMASDENVNIGGLIGGPIRVGAFVANAATREQTGASFWGAMDLAGNLSEICYNANDAGRKFRGVLPQQHGSGKIQRDEDVEVLGFSWPEQYDAFALKGGSWADTDKAVMGISDRSRHNGCQSFDYRDSTVTFRLGHTAKQNTFPISLTLQNGQSTQEGAVATDTSCHGNRYHIKGNLPEEFKDEFYSVVWYVSENSGRSWDVLEGEGDHDITLSKLWNINTDQDVVKEYWIKKKIYSLGGDAVSEKVVIRVANTSTFLNRLRDTLDIYDHSLGVIVDVRQKADMQWIVNGKQQNIEYAITEGRREIVAPIYHSMKGSDTWYLLRTVFLNRCVTIDTIYTHRLPEPVVKSSTNVTCGEIMRDERDGKTYRTVLMGSESAATAPQCWMADNLNYFVTDSRCYNDDVANCERYGRLYSWTQAVGVWSASAMGVCPKGWHIPSQPEWRALQEQTAVRDMRSRLNYWKFNTEATLATNESRFSALPGGGYFFSHPTVGSVQLGVRNGEYDLTNKGWWWSSSFNKSPYTNQSAVALAQINIPVYYTVYYLNNISVGQTGASSIFYGPTQYLGNRTNIDAVTQKNASTAVENNFYFSVRCVKD